MNYKKLDIFNFFVCKIPSFKKTMIHPGMALFGYYSSTWVVKAGESGDQGYPQLHKEYETSLCYIRPCFLKQKMKQKSSNLDFYFFLLFLRPGLLEPY